MHAIRLLAVARLHFYMALCLPCNKHPANYLRATIGPVTQQRSYTVHPCICGPLFTLQDSSKKIQGKIRRVHTNTIDGRWGNLKGWLNGRGGVDRDLLLENLKEYQWRSNCRTQRKDPFLTLLEHIRDGYFPY